jgi:hypothetical protein
VPHANRAMQLYTRLEHELDSLKRQFPTGCCVSVATCTEARRCCFYADSTIATHEQERE